MQISHLRDIALLDPNVTAFLAGDELRNNLPVGILERLTQDSSRYTDYHLFVVEDAGRPLAYAHLTPPHPLCLAEGEEAALVFLAQYLKTSNFPLLSLQGSVRSLETFLKAWPELKAKVITEDRQGLYQLKQVTMPPATGAIWEVARLEHLDVYAEWLQKFCEDIGEPSEDFEACKSGQRQRIEAGDLYCMTIAAQPVAMTVAGRRLPHGRTLGQVYTPPRYRGKGYASELVARLSAHLLGSGFDYCALFTQMSNPTSNRIYQRMGYVWVDEFYMLRFAP